MPDWLNESSLMKHLMDNIKDNIYFMDKQGRIILINNEGARWLGFPSPAELIGKTNMDIFTDEHGVAAYEDEQRIIQTGIPLLGKEEKETWDDGHETWVSTSKMPLRNDAGEIVGTFGISRDITDHKNSEIRAEKFAEENRRFREEMEDELQMAAELQKTFFPSSYPCFPEGVSQAESAVQFSHLHHAGGTVGGDFCSVRKLSETEVGVLLCDVMGHGVRAALGTASMRAIVEEISHREKDPADFLGHMNRVLMPILRQGAQFLFATACYIVLDIATGRVRYANAGHPVPICFNREETNWLVDPETATGAALAISADSQYETVECFVEPGDSVFMYTDGIFEVRSESGEEFGEDRLLDAVREHRVLPELFPALLDKANAFGALDDDVCLVGFHLDRLSEG